MCGWVMLFDKELHIVLSIVKTCVVCRGQRVYLRGEIEILLHVRKHNALLAFLFCIHSHMDLRILNTRAGIRHEEHCRSIQYKMYIYFYEGSAEDVQLWVICLRNEMINYGSLICRQNIICVVVWWNFIITRFIN